MMASRTLAFIASWLEKTPLLLVALGCLSTKGSLRLSLSLCCCNGVKPRKNVGLFLFSAASVGVPACSRFNLLLPPCSFFEGVTGAPAGAAQPSLRAQAVVGLGGLAGASPADAGDAMRSRGATQNGGSGNASGGSRSSSSSGCAGGASSEMPSRRRRFSSRSPASSSSRCRAASVRCWIRERRPCWLSHTALRTAPSCCSAESPALAPSEARAWGCGAVSQGRLVSLSRTGGGPSARRAPPSSSIAEGGDT
mmetsp:Transcript_52517/g.149696  ORF Transcript_52517/g.149696 Transcript_52517/m.149696 type:complete len:252 (+) Transcript_52517:1302-2057(+)